MLRDVVITEDPYCEDDLGPFYSVLHNTYRGGKLVCELALVPLLLGGGRGMDRKGERCCVRYRDYGGFIL